MMLRKCLIVGIFLCFPLTLPAYDDTPKCYKALQREFFNYTLVTQAFSLYQVPQSAWDMVYKSIQQRSQQLPSILNQKAKKIKPNPFQNPFNKKVAKELLYETCYEILVESLKENDVASPLYAHDMFQYIKSQQKERVDACLGETEEEK